MSAYTYDEIAKSIEHMLLDPALKMSDIEEGIRLATDYDVAGVCAAPHAVKRCARLLAGSDVVLVASVGFPHGGQKTAVKREEAKIAIEEGAGELDVLPNISRAVSGDWDWVRKDTAAVIDVAKAAKVPCKLVFENAYLDRSARNTLCDLAAEMHVEWISTGTGCGPAGSIHEDLKQMRERAKPPVQIKAVGGISDLDALLAVRALGALRCGTAETVRILDEARKRLGIEPIDMLGAESFPAGF